MQRVGHGKKENNMQEEKLHYILQTVQWALQKIKALNGGQYCIANSELWRKESESKIMRGLLWRTENRSTLWITYIIIGGLKRKKNNWNKSRLKDTTEEKLQRLKDKSLRRQRGCKSGGTSWSTGK